MNEEQNINVESVEKKTNGFAIAGLVCSILVGGILGLIFSIIGIIKVKKCNSGKGMSIAGIIISVIRLLILGGLIFLSAYVMKTVPKEFNELFCNAMESQKEDCTKLEDGSYNCYFAKCTFDDVEEKEENNDGGSLDDYESTGYNTLVDKGKYTVSFDLEYNFAYTHETGDVRFVEVADIKKSSKDLGGFSIGKNGKLTYNNTEIFNKYYTEVKDEKFVALISSITAIGPYRIFAVTVDGKAYVLYADDSLFSEESMVEGIDSGIEDSFALFNDANKKITDVGYYYGDWGESCDSIATEVYYIEGIKYYYDYGSEKLIELEGSEYVSRIASCSFSSEDDFELDDMFYTVDKRLAISNNKYVKDRNTKKDIVVDYFIYDTYSENFQKGYEFLYLVDENGNWYKMDSVSEYVEPINVVKNIDVTDDRIVVTLDDAVITFD